MQAHAPKQDKRVAQLKYLEDRIARCHSRLFRIANVLDKLVKTKRRIEKAAATELGFADTVVGRDKAKKVLVKPKVTDVTDIPWSEMTGDDLRIPDNLRRDKAVEFGEKLEAALRTELQAANDRLAKAWNDSTPTGSLKAQGGKPSDEQVAAEIRRQQAEHKKAKAAGRIAKLKAKQSGEMAKMPLSGKDALKAIGAK
jgi:hypothetical protein